MLPSLRLPDTGLESIMVLTFSWWKLSMEEVPRYHNNTSYGSRERRDWETVKEGRNWGSGDRQCALMTYSMCDSKLSHLKDNPNFQWKCLSIPHLPIGISTRIPCRWSHNLRQKTDITRKWQVVTYARKFALEWSCLVHYIWIYLYVGSN